MRHRELPRNGPWMFLAYDHGMTRGPQIFNPVPKSMNPQYVLEIAEKGKFDGIILEPGLAKSYWFPWPLHYGEKVAPLIVKLNGVTRFSPTEAPNAPQFCSVEYAVEMLGASAVGYTVYLGSRYEPQMLSELGHIVEEAHRIGKKLWQDIPVIGWMYFARFLKEGVRWLENPDDMAYAARVGAELGCNIVKIHWTGSAKSFRRVVESAGPKTRVVIAGGIKTDSDKQFLETVKEALGAGAAGVVAGRNIWQHSDPIKLAAKLRSIIDAKN